MHLEAGATKKNLSWALHKRKFKILEIVYKYSKTATQK